MRSRTSLAESLGIETSYALKARQLLLSGSGVEAERRWKCKPLKSLPMAHFSEVSPNLISLDLSPVRGIGRLSHQF
jgi:hypothetical protein